jgi:hypothetical protein
LSLGRITTHEIKDVKEALGKVIPYLDIYLEKEQIEIVPYFAGKLKPDVPVLHIHPAAVSLGPLRLLSILLSRIRKHFNILF